MSDEKTTPNPIPPPTYPEYRLTLVWRSDEDGNGIRTYLECEGQLLQGSFHPTLDLHDALEAALTNFFETEQNG